MTHAAEYIELQALGIELHDLRTRRNARWPRLDVDRDRRLLADIVEARFAAIVAAEV